MCIILIILDRNRKNKIIILAVCIVQELKYVITKLGTENFIIYKNGNVEYKSQK